MDGRDSLATAGKVRAPDAGSAPARLSTVLLERLKRDSVTPEPWHSLILTAVESDAALDELLARGDRAGAREEPTTKPTPTTKAKPQAAATATLRAITVEGFRGIGRAARLDIPAGPGLTLVVGRNGSGKSSFAEALELLLTGDTFRWSGKKSKVWKDGWRNLHHPTAALHAELIVEGEKTPATITRKWANEAPLEAVETSVQVQGKPKTDLASLGWTQALVTHRPFLSYNELGSMLEEGPSKLYDALASILGLDDLVAAHERLADARKPREKAHKDAVDMRKRIVETLATMEDARARALFTTLTREDWGLDEAERVVSQTGPDGATDKELALLRQLAALPLPDPIQTEAIIRALRDAAAAQKATAGTLASRSKDLAEILDHALRFHDRHGDAACPVCGKKGALTPTWHEEQAQEMKRLRDTARDATNAQTAATTAARRASDLSVPRADLVQRAKEVGLDPQHVLIHLDTWQQALANPDLEQLASSLDSVSTSLRTSISTLRTQAAAEVQRREDLWRPLALQIAGWLPLARTAREGFAPIAPLKKAESWLKDTVSDLRTEQFAPIKEKCQGVWMKLRQQSNVSLEDVKLSGNNTARKVELSVTVDGVEGAALGVMSQGELHALALSLFIPRATLPESPFRFMVIDDPVQSMDPSRVDGLARVLETAAKDRQVIVFTHDDRLPESIRRMGISATVREVTRRESSAVDVIPGRDPVSRHIEDALAVAKTEGLPAVAAKRVIPGLCRLAIEAACSETFRRRRLARGERHADVEDLLAQSSGTKTFVSLALFDDPQRAGDVMPRLDKESKSFADVYRMCNEGAHGVEVGARVGFIRETEKLARWLQGVK